MNTRILSASTLKGTPVKNKDQKNIGKIHDVMIDIETGDILYAVLSFGGFMGIGDKYFAIPLEALEWTTKREGNHEIMLDISKERLENAPGFDKDNWPLEASPEFIHTVYDYYGYTRPTRERAFVRK